MSGEVGILLVKLIFSLLILGYCIYYFISNFGWIGALPIVAGIGAYLVAKGAKMVEINSFLALGVYIVALIFLMCAFFPKIMRHSRKRRTDKGVK